MTSVDWGGNIYRSLMAGNRQRIATEKHAFNHDDCCWRHSNASKCGDGLKSLALLDVCEHRRRRTLHTTCTGLCTLTACIHHRRRSNI